MEDGILFWQVRVKVTQAPEPFKVKNGKKEENLQYLEEPEERSFLYDPLGFSSEKSYGLELTAKNRVNWFFYAKADTELEALKIGHAWRASLIHKFKGLDAIIEARPIDINTLMDGRGDNIKEIVLPEGLLTKKIDILEKFVNIFYLNKHHRVNLYIVWRRNPYKINLTTPEESNYSVRVFVNFNNKFKDMKELSAMEGNLSFLFLEVENQKGEKARIVDSKGISLEYLMCGEVFKNGASLRTRLISKEVNFDFPENLPLPKVPILKNENVRYLDLTKRYMETAVSVGKHVKNGVETDHATFVPINKLPQHCAIFGKSGSGKTYFLARFIEELRKKLSSAGILVLNVAKENQERYYKDFLTLKYSDNNFHIPYFAGDQDYNFKRRLQETATYICASLGLKNVFEKIIYRTMVGFMELDKKLPEQFYHLLRGVENYMNKNPYGPEEQSNLMQAFRNRMNTFNEDKILDVLKLSYGIPIWIQNWIRGKNIFLDMSMCSKFVKLLVVNAIFQLVRTITKDFEAEELKNLIVIDEAHAILEKPLTNNSDDADFIMKEQMTKIFSELIKEYRSRGVGFIIADQSPSLLFEDAVSQPSIKVLFRLDYPNNVIFSEDSEERQILTQLPNRLALVFNGATGEKYLIKTIDYSAKV